MAEVGCEKRSPEAKAGPSETSRHGTRKLPLNALTIITLGLLAVLLMGIWITARKGPVASPEAQVRIDIDDIRRKAAGGAAQAQTDLGVAYAKGQGLPQNYAEAAKWYLKAAEQGNARAQLAIGELHEAGRGVARDDTAAAQWYRRAAEQGLAAAQYSLAVMYLMGKGVKQNTPEALKWYRLAADQGDALAQYNLGMRYYEGKDVVPDSVEAYTWLSLAGAGGVEDANRVLSALKDKMSRQQISDAKARLAAFSIKRPSTPAR